MARPDAVATLKEQFRLSKLCIDEPPTPEQALRNAAMISGEDPTLVGNGILQTIDIASQPHEELSSRPIQLDNYLARTIIHESFNELVRVLSQFDFDYRERKIFSAALCVTADTDNQNKLLLHIALGGDLNRLERGQTALHYASKLKKSDLVSILLENGADPD
jgi:hypothetical protein